MLNAKQASIQWRYPRLYVWCVQQILFRPREAPWCLIAFAMLVPLGLMDRRARLALLESTNLSQDQRNVASVKEGNIPPELQLFQNQHVSSAPLIRSHQRGVLPTPPA